MVLAARNITDDNEKVEERRRGFRKIIKETMEYCLAEKWGCGYKLPENCKAVALTPNASYQLDKAGIDYATFGDYFSSGEAWEDTDSYLESQAFWIKEFDEFAQELFPDAKKLKIKLASLYFENIRYMVDCIILSSRILSKFIREAKPAKIWFVPEVYGEDRLSLRDSFAFGESQFYRLAPIICKQENVPFEKLAPESENCIATDTDKKSLFNTAKKQKLSLKEKSLAKLKLAKKPLSRYLCLFSAFAFIKDKKIGNVLVVRESSFVNAFYRDCKKYGFGVYYKQNGFIYKLDWFPSLADTSFKDMEYKSSGRGINFPAAVNNFTEGAIMRWINEEAGVDVSSLLYSRIQFFLEDVFAETLFRIKKYLAFYSKHHIDFVISYTLSGIDDHAAVAAANVSATTKCIYFSHGADALGIKTRYFTDYCFFDYLFVSTPCEVSYIRDLAALFHNERIIIEEYDHFRNQFERYRKPIDKNLDKRNKQVVLFVPIIREERIDLPIERGQLLQWDYFKWHNALIEYFSARKDCHFIWKSLPQGYDRGDTIQEILDDKDSRNIEFSSCRLADCFTKVDKVICDIPSTAFFECIFAGLPTVALYVPKDQDIQNKAHIDYKKSIQPYANIKEGLKAVEEFLNSDPQEYIVPQSRGKIFVPDFLN